MSKHTKITADNPNTVEIQCFKTTIKKLSTRDGLGILHNFVIGQDVIITVLSKREVEMVTITGIKHTKWIFDTIDINGKPLGWIYAESVFPEMVSQDTGLILH